MAIAITHFEAFCGFLPLPMIVKYLDAVPELASVLSDPVVDSFRSAIGQLTGEVSEGPDPAKDALRELFSTLMNAPAEDVKQAISSIRLRYLNGQVSQEELDIKDLLLRLDDQFPNDIGVLCTFVLNIVKLEPGQAVFLKANEPHAYISGGTNTLIHNSDQVLRRLNIRYCRDDGHFRYAISCTNLLCAKYSLLMQIMLFELVSPQNCVT